MCPIICFHDLAHQRAHGSCQEIASQPSSSQSLHAAGALTATWLLRSAFQDALVGEPVVPHLCWKAGWRGCHSQADRLEIHWTTFFKTLLFMCSTGCPDCNSPSGPPDNGEFGNNGVGFDIAMQCKSLQPVQGSRLTLLLAEQKNQGLTPRVGPVGDGVGLGEELLAGFIIKALVAYIADIILCRAQVAYVRHHRTRRGSSPDTVLDNTFAGLGGLVSEPKHGTVKYPDRHAGVCLARAGAQPGV